MVSWAAVLGLAVIAFGMVVTPGPNMIYLVSRSVSQGRNAGLISLRVHRYLTGTALAAFAVRLVTERPHPA